MSRPIIHASLPDTGLVDVRHLVNHVSFEAVATEATLQRVGPDVELAITGDLTGVPPLGFVLMTVPVGYRPPGFKYRGGVVIGDATGHIRTATTLYAMNVYCDRVEGARLRTVLRWFTTDPWPT